MQVYGLDGLPIPLDNARILINDVAARTVGETIIKTTAGEMRIITAHMVVDQSPSTETGEEHIPVLYATNVFYSRGHTQFPTVAAVYVTRASAAGGHGQVVVDVIATCPGRVLSLDEVMAPQAAA